MRLSRAGACFVVALIYLVLRVTIPMMRLGFLNSIALVVVSIALMMLVQLALAVCIAGIGLRPRNAFLLALVSALVFVGMLMILNSPHLSASKHVLRGLVGFQQLALMLFAAFLGCGFSYIVREPNILLPVAMFAAVVDLWNVSIGPLGQVIKTKPDMVAAVAVQMPTPVPGIPGTMIGMGDFVFLALYFSVLYRFAMNVRGTFWLGYALLTASMLFVLSSGVLPALIPVALAVIIANRRLFKLSRDEKLAIVYVGIFVVVLLTASGVFFLRHR